MERGESNNHLEHRSWKLSAYFKCPGQADWVNLQVCLFTIKSMYPLTQALVGELTEAASLVYRLSADMWRLWSPEGYMDYIAKPWLKPKVGFRNLYSSYLLDTIRCKYSNSAVWGSFKSEPISPMGVFSNRRRRNATTIKTQTFLKIDWSIQSTVSSY